MRSPSKKKTKKGFALITALWIVVVMIILSTALIATSTRTLFVVGNYKIRKQVTALAECGINEALAHLIQDKTWAGTLPDNTTPDPLKNLPSNMEYKVSFDADTTGYYSVNNLNSSVPAKGCKGRTIPPYSANIICVASVAGVSRIVDVFIQPASDRDSLLLVQNQIDIKLPTDQGNLNLMSENSGLADLHSNMTGNAINVTANSINLKGQKISAVGNITLTSSVAETVSGTIQSSDSPITIPPMLDPKELDTRGNKPYILPRGTYTKINNTTYSFHDDYGVTPDRTITTGVLPGVTVKDGKLIFSENQIVNGELTINGELSFDEGAYLQLENDDKYYEWGGDETVALGSLVVNDGRISGNGSVVAERNVRFDVSNTINSADPREKINIFAGGTVTMVSNSDTMAAFSGFIHAGKLVATEIKNASGYPKDLTIYGGVVVNQNTLEPLPLPPWEFGSGTGGGGGDASAPPPSEPMPGPPSSEPGPPSSEPGPPSSEPPPSSKPMPAPPSTEPILLPPSTEPMPPPSTPMPAPPKPKPTPTLPPKSMPTPTLPPKSMPMPMPAPPSEPMPMPMPMPMPAPEPVITDGDVVMANIKNLTIVYDEDYLNLINSKQSYQNYNISSWTEYSK